MLRKKIYAWHRTLSLIIALPVVLWAASGFMHPLMTTIRPKVATQFLPVTVIDSSKIILSLREALHKNNLAQFHNFRLVHIDTNWFYQVQPEANEIPVYLSTRTGRKLNKGDALYAQYLAKQFLEGPVKPITPTVLYASLLAPGNKSLVRATMPAESIPVHDCCDAATSFILSKEKGSKVTSVTLLRSFDDEYKFVNRLLPAYKVNFDRADGIRVYVETTTDRFAFAVDNKRALFDTLFSWFHTWTWMDALGNTKYILMALLLTFAFASTLIGLYIFFVTKTKKSNGNAVMAARRNHRWTSVLISLFTLMFSFSGAFHALEKLKPDNRYDFYNRQVISREAADLNMTALQQVVQQSITNISAVQMNNNLYWQVFPVNNPNPKGQAIQAVRKDLMKDKEVAPPNAIYVNANDYTLLVDGEKKYARYLANQFGHHTEEEVKSTTAITKFEDEYGFVNKRLPVWKVSYATNRNERYYVETSAGKLAVRVDDRDLYEGYSFALLHKHHFMDFAGKSVRDFSTMFWAMAQIAMVAVGLILWRKAINNKKTKTNHHA